MILKSNLLIFILWGSVAGFTQKTLHPFPQHSTYYPGVISPNHISQEIQDDSTASFYWQWKNKYLKRSPCFDGYYIWSENAGKYHECVSEGQGYGMIIVVLMAGCDPGAQRVFDGLFHYYQQYPSNRSKYLMSWEQGKGCQQRKESSAADGDIDIAFSLLLASSQWTSKGKINYLQEATNIINSIKEQEINKKTFNILLSNAVEADSKDYFDMRSSDFIASELRSFMFTDKKIWSIVLDNNYHLFTYLQKSYSRETGLVPDFVQHINTKPKPAKRFYLETQYDGNYYYNACRVPWRIALDYIISGEQRAKTFVEPINQWIRQTTENNPDNISAGYTLAGDDLRNHYFEALSFIAPFAIAAMVDRKNQQWLNELWDYITNFKLKDYDYYDNSIKMLCLLVLSRNYWSP